MGRLVKTGSGTSQNGRLIRVGESTVKPYFQTAQKRTVTALPNAGTPTADRARNNLVTGNRLLPHVTEYQGIPVSGKKNGYWQADTSDLEQQRLAAGLKSVPSMAFHYHYDAEAENKRMEESRAEAGRLTAEIAARKNNLYQLQRDEKRSALETRRAVQPGYVARAQRRN